MASLPSSKSNEKPQWCNVGGNLRSQLFDQRSSASTKVLPLTAAQTLTSSSSCILQGEEAMDDCCTTACHWSEYFKQKIGSRPSKHPGPGLGCIVRSLEILCCSHIKRDLTLNSGVSFSIFVKKFLNLLKKRKKNHRVADQLAWLDSSKMQEFAKETIYLEYMVRPFSLFMFTYLPTLTNLV